MNLKEKSIALYTLILKEVARIFTIWLHALLPPLITITLYFIIFGKFIGKHMIMIHGFTYMQYIAPGLIAIPMITGAYSNTASSLFMSKFNRSIEELLISPMPNYIMLFGFIAGSLFRVILMTVLAIIVALFFTHLELYSITILTLTVLFSSTLFALIGTINGIFARKFDDAFFVPVFILTPLTYLSGVFYSIDSLPPLWHHLTLLNPLFYIIDAFRYGMLGVSNTNIFQALSTILGFAMILFLINLYILKKGWGIRE